MKKIRVWYQQKVIAIGIAILIVLGLFVYVAATLPEKFVYEEHLSDVVLTVSRKESGESREINLQQMSYYVMTSEASVQRLAEIYNGENTNQFWNIFTNHTFMKTKAKEVAYDSCLRDLIYSMEAEEAGITLDEEEVAQVWARAEDICAGLSYQQQLVTKFTPELLEPVLERVALASKYANDLVENHDFSYSEHMPEVEVEIGGDYYKSRLALYDVEVADFWNDINLGRITITQTEN